VFTQVISIQHHVTIPIINQLDLQPMAAVIVYLGSPYALRKGKHYFLMVQQEQTVPVVVIIHKDMLLLQYQGANVTVDHQRKIVPVT
jgi:hypothetical protein